MDGYFEILLPKESSLDGWSFKVPQFEWDGVLYPQGPPECTFGSNFHLKFRDIFDYDYIRSKVPASLRQIDWQAIVIEGDGLDIFMSQQYGLGEGEQAGFSFKDLLTTLLSKEPIWLAGFSAQCDGYSRSYLGDIGKVLECFEDSEDWHAGFLVCHDAAPVYSSFNK